MQLIRPTLRQPPAPRHVHDWDDQERHATWLELFFDLVFVVAVARLGVILHDDHDVAAATVVVAAGWILLAVLKSSYVASLASESTDQSEPAEQAESRSG